MIHPVILCGGSGTRLWPLSRQAFPKQFAPLFGSESLFQACVRRVTSDGFAPPLVVTSDQHRFIAARQMADAGSEGGHVLVEPAPRNTAPAVLAAALWLMERAGEGDDPLMLIAPSDHLIPDADGFRSAVLAARDAARAGRIVTFGIAPTKPETGYGYLALAEEADATTPTPQPLAGFVEKPDQAKAQRMLAEGRHLWNAGIFLFSAKTMIDAFKAHAGQMVAGAARALREGTSTLAATRIAEAPWAALPSISIDYAIMEKVANLWVMPYHGRWSDLGSWQAVKQESAGDEHGNVLSARALAIDCEKTLLRSEADGLQLVGIGLRDIVAVAMPDAVLIAHASEAQRVKDVTEALKARGAAQAQRFLHDRRPWGMFETLASGESFHVKRIVVDAGAALSLQSHRHRAEHWIVVEGTAKVTIDGTVKLLSHDQSTYVPLGAIHRLENPGTEPLVMIEVQTGTYFGEDDIVRYEDVYARV